MKRKITNYRKPTYADGINLARIVDGISHYPFGWQLKELAQDLGVSERTARRYIKALSQEFLDDEGNPIFAIEKKEQGAVLIKKSKEPKPISASIYHLISVYLALEFFKMLGENVVAFSVENVFEIMEKQLSPRERDLLKDLPRKFYTAPYAQKDYSNKVDILEDLIKAIVYQNIIKITYKRPSGEEWNYTLEPLTLLYHKGGFYLIARSVKHQYSVYFNLERIQNIQLQSEKFEYPKKYHPEQMLEGAFGIFAGPAKEIKLRFAPELKEYITAYKWHKSQKFEPLKDGSVIMTLKVTDSEELKAWVRSFGRKVKRIKS